jgi:hypothetical protein
LSLTCSSNICLREISKNAIAALSQLRAGSAAPMGAFAQRRLFGEARCKLTLSLASEVFNQKLFSFIVKDPK